ncbi:MAG TPA: ComEC/Rec2 family competence protein, partial [Candidatus Binatia bacterium]|nr:ComEC/Rec2 family competence protein [Candidatus Binatia bacterium]
MGAARFVLPATLAGVALGILAADVAPVPVGWALAAGAVLTSLSALGRVATGTVLGVAVIAVGVGGWRGAPPATFAQPDRPPLSVVVDGAAHEMTGTIVDDPRPRADRLELVIGDVRLERPDGPVALADRLLVWLPRGIDARSGDRLRLTSRVDLPEDFDGFAYREYLERQGVGGIARARSGEVVEAAGGLVSLLAGARGALLGGLNDLVPEPEAALGAGILLGVRTSMAPEVSDAFETAGLTHIVAVSGWNIAIVAAVVAALVRPLARRPGGRWTTAAVAAATVAAYVLLTGASPSVVRAALMAAAMLVARLGGSRAHAASALALAALLMLLAAPPVLWDVGFQLSLLATGGLIWFGAPIERRLAGWPAWIREPVALTMAAQLTTLPVILVNFERLSLVAPIANVLVVPFVPVAMLFSAVAAVAGILTAIVEPPLVGTAVGWFAGGAAWIVLRTIIVLGSTIASVPHAALDVMIPPSLAIAWLPILALASWALREPVSGTDRTGAEEERPSALATVARRALRPAPVLTGLGAILLAITLAGLPDGRLHVTVMDVGQGDAILVEAPGGATMLVDGG